jgi:very-short-patch-repair endonuclease
MNYKTHYNYRNKANAIELRQNMTKAEACLWKFALKAGKMKGYGFRKQRPVLNYIADFMCLELNLIIEVDGGIHNNEEIMERDEIKQKDLESHGYTVLRFTNEQVLTNINWVIDSLAAWISRYEKENSITHVPRPRWAPPTPPRGGGQNVD